MDVLVVSGCSGEKRYDDVPIGSSDIDSSSREDLIREYPEYVAQAEEIYAGDEHEVVRDAVANLREHVSVSWHIVSAGYGLVEEDEEIVAYDCTLSDIDAVRERAGRMGYNPGALTIDETRRVVGREKNMADDLRHLLGGNFDVAFLVLSEPYYTAVSDALSKLPDGITVMAIASEGSRDKIGESIWVPATGEVREELGTSWFRLRGELLRRVSEKAEGSALEDVARKPEVVEDFLPVEVDS